MGYRGGVKMHGYDEEELAYTGEQAYWASIVRALASGEVSIKSMHPSAKKQLLEDVENYKLTGEINFD